MKPPEPVLDQLAKSTRPGRVVGCGSPVTSLDAACMVFADSASPLGRPILTISPSEDTATSSAIGSTARPWADGNRARSTNSRRDGRPFDGASAVTAATLSPTTG